MLKVLPQTSRLHPYVLSHRVRRTHLQLSIIPLSQRILQLGSRLQAHRPSFGHCQGSENQNLATPLTFWVRNSCFQGSRRALDARCRASDSDKENSSQSSAMSNDGLLHATLRSALWLSYGFYMAWLFVLPFAPGDPAWAIKQDVIDRLIDLSINFFYLVPVASSVLPDYVQAPILHPTDEALFNFVNAWSIMFGPLLVADRKSSRMQPPAMTLWLGQVFLTNVFLIPYMALRLGPRAATSLSFHELDVPGTAGASADLPSRLARIVFGAARPMGLVCGVIGVLSLVWFALGRGTEGFGDIRDRYEVFAAAASSDRLTYAFLWDLVLYAIFQAWLMWELRGGLSWGKGKEHFELVRFVPFFGLAAHLALMSAEMEGSEGRDIKKE